VTDTPLRLVVMGVSGCGKSSLAAALSVALDVALIEGDDHHTDANRSKMSQGIALTDEDRVGWLETLGGLLAQCSRGIVMSCSALKRSYRDQLRAASPGLRFVFMDLPFDDALLRVSRRGESHFFSPQLVRNQFDVLERPEGETGVLRVDARRPTNELLGEVLAILRK
jgi:gluconokinase